LLNAPWGVGIAPLDFGRFSHDLLIGSIAGGGDTQSSAFIAAYDLATGNIDRPSSVTPAGSLAINGHLGLSPGNRHPTGINDPQPRPPHEMLLTATEPGSGGLFGYLTAVAAD